MSEQISAKELKQLLACDFETGKLTWLTRPLDIFKTNGYHPLQHSCDKWNTKFSGKTAFTFKEKRGYLSGRIFRKGYLAHRIIWALHTGEWPTEQIDHINGDPADNRITNLREALGSQNQYNRGKTSKNTSGYKGVYLHKKTGKWLAQIGVAGRVKYLGYFETPLLAHAAYCEAASRLHGAFANNGQAITGEVKCF